MSSNAGLRKRDRFRRGVDTGITNPHRITLRKDGVELRAVFKKLSTDLASRTETCDR